MLSIKQAMTKKLQSFIFNISRKMVILHLKTGKFYIWSSIVYLFLLGYNLFNNKIPLSLPAFNLIKTLPMVISNWIYTFVNKIINQVGQSKHCCTSSDFHLFSHKKAKERAWNSKLNGSFWLKHTHTHTWVLLKDMPTLLQVLVWVCLSKFITQQYQLHSCDEGTQTNIHTC